jgi:colanic acid/amylovoran biosynthesis glycosyltransferase
MGDGLVKVIHSFPIWLPQTQTWMYNQVRCLPAGVESHVVCERTENLDQFWLPNIHNLSEAPRRQYYWDKGLRKLRIRRHLGLLARTASRLRADILHSHFGNIGWADIGAIRRADTRHVVTFYGHDVSRLPGFDPTWLGRYKKLFETVDLILCEGPHMARCVVDLGCMENKVTVHHLGVMVNEIPFQPRALSPGEPLRVLIAASFREKKGIPYALEALSSLQHKVTLQTTIIGDAGKEPEAQAEKRKILATIDKNGLRSKVRMLGYQPHEVFFREAYRHHVFLSPSVTASDGNTEGGAPVSIIEVAASGMPVVSTTHCDIPEIIVDGVTGLLAPERDIDGLTRHLTWLVENPGLWSGMVEAGRRHVETHFDAQKQGDRLAGIYRELIAK